MHPSSSRRSARATTAGRRCSRSARIRAGGASSSRAIDAGPTDTVLDVATGTAAVALELVRQKDCYVVGVDRTPEMLDEGRRRVDARGRRRQGAARARATRATLPFERRHASTRSRSPTSCATSTTRRDAARARARGEARAARSPGSSSASRAASGARSGKLWVRAGLPAAGPADRRRLARGRDVPRAVDQRALRSAGRCRRASLRRGATPASTTSPCRRLSLGGGIVTWGRRS